MSYEKGKANEKSLGVLGGIDVVAEVIMEEVETALDNIVLYSESDFGVESQNSKTSSSKESEIDKRGRSGFFL